MCIINVFLHFYLFYRFGIEAITLEGHEKKGRGIYVSVLQVGRYEILSSVNNTFFFFRLIHFS